jgi:hypothetical protein
LLPDASAGPNIGTRPDNSNNNANNIGANTNGNTNNNNAANSFGPGRQGVGIVQAGSQGHFTINGGVKKVGAVAVGGGDNRIMVQRDGDKIVARQFPVHTAQGQQVPQGPYSNSTPSTSSHRPPPTVAAPAASMQPPSQPNVQKQTEAMQQQAGGGAAENGAARFECLDGAAPAELRSIARQLGTEISEVDPSGLRGQVTAALGRLNMQDLSRRLAEGHIDASLCKERRELEWLLVQNLLTRARSGGPDGNAGVIELPPQAPAAMSERRGVPPATGSSSRPVSELVVTGLSGASVLQKPELEVGELNIGAGKFNPTEQLMKDQLLSLLGYSKTSTIEALTGFRGGLNEGVWFVKDPPAKDLVLKLVKCNRVSNRILTEAENFVKLLADYPKIASDDALAFPVRIFKCLGPPPERQHRYDLIVMWKVKGDRLAEVIARKWYAKDHELIWKIFERLGETLAEFHHRYSDSQHGDFQPSNVFYDQEASQFSFIDIGGMGVPTRETDTEHFNKALKLLADAYGSQLTNGQRSFEGGYAAGKRARGN